MERVSQLILTPKSTFIEVQKCLNMYMFHEHMAI